jgi:hypothetical protein
MHTLRLGAILMLAFAGCAPASATSPSNLATTDPLPGLAAKPDPVQKVTLYVLSPDDRLGGNVSITGLAITISTDGFGPVTAVTDKQGSVSFWVPAAAQWIAVHTGTTAIDDRVATCFTPLDVVLTLPLHRREGWLIIRQAACS